MKNLPPQSMNGRLQILTKRQPMLLSGSKPGRPPVGVPGMAQAPVWVLLGRRHGDNQQLLGLAAALGEPFATVPLAFNVLASLPNVLRGRSLLSLRDRRVLPDGQPQLIMGSGRRVVPVARWLQRHAEGYPRLLHVGRPWAPLQWFDLIITTPQYGLPARPNVLCNLLPFQPAPPVERELPFEWSERFESLPRPWTVVLLGGHSRPYVFDRLAAARLADEANAVVQKQGGSALLLSSPRTPEDCLDLIERRLQAPSLLCRWRRQPGLYTWMLRRADQFIVTSDSATMVGDALVTGKPVRRFDLPQRPDWRLQLAAGWRHAALRHPWLDAANRRLRNAGLLSSVRDLGEYHRRLEAIGAFSDGRVAPALARRERERTLARVRGLLDQAPRMLLQEPPRP